MDEVGRTASNVRGSKTPGHDYAERHGTTSDRWDSEQSSGSPSLGQIAWGLVRRYTDEFEARYGRRHGQAYADKAPGLDAQGLDDATEIASDWWGANVAAMKRLLGFGIQQGEMVTLLDQWMKFYDARGWAPMSLFQLIWYCQKIRKIIPASKSYQKKKGPVKRVVKKRSQV